MATLETLQVNINTLLQNNLRAERGLNRLNRRTTKLTKNSNLLRVGLKRLGVVFAAYLAVRTITDIVKLADNYNILNERLRSLSDTTQQYNILQKGLYQSSQLTGVSFETTVELANRLLLVQKQLGATDNELLLFTSSIQKLGVLSGANTANLSSGIRQLSQGLSSGVLRAEEFNSILENIPIVANAIAKGLGVSTGELRKSVLAGEILSKDVFDAILSQIPEINKQFAEFPASISRGTAQLSNSFSRLVGILFKVTGLQDSIAKTFQVIAQNIDFYSDALSPKTATEELKEYYALLIQTQEAFDIRSNQQTNFDNSSLKEELQGEIDALKERIRLKILEINKTADMEAQAIKDKASTDAANDARIKSIADKKAKDKATADRIAANMEYAQIEYQNSRIIAANTEADRIAANMEYAQKQYDISRLAEARIIAANERREARNIEYAQIEYQNSRLAELEDRRINKSKELEVYRRTQAEVDAKESDKQLEEKYKRSKLETLDLAFNTNLRNAFAKSETLTKMQQLDRQRELEVMGQKTVADSLGLLAQHSAEAFELNKALSIATALVKAPEAIISSFAYGSAVGGPIVGGIFAAIAAAATAKQVQLISQSTFTPPRQFGGQVIGGQTYRVNEAGSETFQNRRGEQFFIPQESGNIIANQQNKDYTISIKLDTAGTQGLSVQQNNTGAVINIVLSEIINNINSKGSVVKALRNNFNLEGRVR